MRLFSWPEKNSLLFSLLLGNWRHRRCAGTLIDLYNEKIRVQQFPQLRRDRLSHQPRRKDHAMATITQQNLQKDLELLQNKATRMRIDSVRSTSAAGSGHPTSCASAAEIMSVLFFSVMRYDPKDPKNPANDVFVLSKGHAAPILYSAWAEAGLFPREHLLTLRRIDSDLEGHPTPRLSFVDVATGSLGQGISAALGLAINFKELEKQSNRIYVLLGDGEVAEGSVWEAAEIAGRLKVDNLCATVDVNRLGQSGPTMLEHDLGTYAARWESFGWHTIQVDGHNIPALVAAYDEAARTRNRPTVVLARTLKGKDLGKNIENQLDKHGKPLEGDDEKQALAALERQLRNDVPAWTPRLPVKSQSTALKPEPSYPQPPYKIGDKEIATRRAFGQALTAIGRQDQRIVALDGDVKNSTYTEEFLGVAHERFVEGYIAEQNMVGMAMGLAARGKIPFAATFACFFTRAYDQIRMAAISQTNIKLAGTHVGVSIGEDGPSQMGLEDLAMICAQPGFTVFYPSDATSAWAATVLAAQTNGPAYLRLGRPNNPILYASNEQFQTGKCKILRQSSQDQVLVIAGGVTVFEALAVYEELKQAGTLIRVIDLFSIVPIDHAALREAAKACGGRVLTVEDHYAHGGLGDAVLSALAADRISVTKLAVREIPRSGKPRELLERYGISRRHIVEEVKKILSVKV
jgi:transketolase